MIANVHSQPRFGPVTLVAGDERYWRCDVCGVDLELGALEEMTRYAEGTLPLVRCLQHSDV